MEMAVETDTQHVEQTDAVAAAVAALDSGQEAPAIPTDSAVTPPVAEPVVPVTAPVTAPVTEVAPVDEPYSVHEVWQPLLDQLPDAWKNQALDAIKKTESGANKRIEQLSAERMPDEYRDLIREAQERGITPDQFAASYNTHAQMMRQLNEDPDGFIDDMKAQVDEAVKQGLISRKEGAAAKEQLDDDVTDLLTPEQQELREAQREIKELKGTVQQRELREAQAEDAKQAQELEHIGRQFITDVEGAFIAAGLVDDQGGHLTSRENRAALAQIAAGYLSENDAMTNAEAIQKAVAALGGLERFRPQSAPAIPIGGTAAMPPAPGGKPQFATRADAEAAQIAAIRALQSNEQN